MTEEVGLIERAGGAVGTEIGGLEAVEMFEVEVGTEVEAELNEFALLGREGGAQGCLIEVEVGIEAELTAEAEPRGLLGVGGDFGISTDLRAVGAPIEANKPGVEGVEVVDTFEKDGREEVFEKSGSLLRVEEVEVADIGVRGSAGL